MAKFVGIDRTAFANRFWKAPQDFRFFSEMSVVPLGAHEAPQAGLHFPLAFIQQQDTYDLVAVSGVQASRNVAVDPLSGRWVGSYLPDLAKVYPFRLASNQSDELVVVVDEESGLVTNDPSDWAFFQPNGEPEAQLAQVVAALNRLQQGRMGAFQLCKQIADAGLIEPWPLEVKSDTGSHNIDGLYRINEAALNALDDAAFVGLRQSNAIGLVYSQLLSMGNVRKLALMAYEHQQRSASPSSYNDGFENDTISFS